MKRKVNGADLNTYGVFDLLVSGARFTAEYTEEDAVEHYMRLHPDADERKVRRELRSELKKVGR